MENTEEIYHFLEDFSKRKPKNIPQELNEYLAYVARTGDPVYQWSLVKSLFKEKLLSVITDFYETSPGIDIPSYPNVDPFNYDIMKDSLLERLDSFNSAPFTVQRICELLTCPRKQYNRIDKFMRAVEKNILVVSTREPGIQRHVEIENGEPVEPVVNGTDNNSEFNVDVEMEDMSWKDKTSEPIKLEPQPSSSDTITTSECIKQIDKIETEELSTENKEQSEQKCNSDISKSVSNEQHELEDKTNVNKIEESSVTLTDNVKTENLIPDEHKIESEMKVDIPAKTELVIPEIRVDDAEMTEQNIIEANEAQEKTNDVTVTVVKENEIPPIDIKISSDKPITSSDEGSLSSSDNTDCNSNSPKPNCETAQEVQSDLQPAQQPDLQPTLQPEIKEVIETKNQEEVKPINVNMEENNESKSITLQTDNYSISDVNSVISSNPEDVSSEVVKEEELKKEETEQITSNDNPPKEVDATLNKTESVE